MQPDAQELRLGSLLVIQNEQSSPLPLERTTVSAQIVGPVARVRVVQQFGNPFTTPVELEYLFPLPHKAAVVDYQLTIGERQIRAEIKELEAARRVYQAAVDAGQRASLLEQRRPNLFSLQVGNVQPNEKIICTLEYEERLSFQDGTYQFVFPMGITPRYHSPSLSIGTALSADSPLAQPGERIAPVELQLSIDAGTPIADPTSPSHAIQLKRVDEQHISLELTGENIPNKDFVLRYAVSGETITTAAWSSADGDSEIALVTLIPPRLTLDGEPAPREFIFVIDRSGSMSTAPMTQAKNALRACLRGLNPHDTFAIQAFDSTIEWFVQAALSVTQINIDRADSWLDTIASRGGTEILPAIDAALALPTDPQRQRYVVFLTDGSVSADEQAIRKIARQRGSARIFTFGIGPSVNRFLLDKIAQMGRGTAEFVGVNEDIETAITRFQDRASYPALQDIQLSWQNAEGWDTYPEMLPDLYVGQPLEIVTRLKRRGDDARLHFKGQLRGVPVEITAPVAPPPAENPTLKRLWARARVESLLDQGREQSDQDSIRQQVISLSLEHRLLTPFTAFVAVDSEVTTGGEAKPIRVSTPLPEGLEYERFGGGGVVASLGGIPRQMMSAAPMPASPSMQSAPTFSRKRAPGNEQESFKLRAYTPPPDSLNDALVSPNDRNAAPDQSAKSAERIPDFSSIEERIKWLARTQKVDGSWDDDAELTAAALLAFVRAGHTTRSGSYRQQVRKAATWLAGAGASAQGFAAFVAARALNELQAATSDSVFVAAQLPAPTTNPERAAAGDAALTLPTVAASLDDLRVLALALGNAQASPELKQGDQQKLVQVWLAVGKPS